MTGLVLAVVVSGRLALGVNYWASHAATEMWRKWDPQVVEEDLRVLAENGLTTVRAFPNWADFQPIHAVFRAGSNCDVVWETRLFDTEEPLPDTPCGRAGVDERMVERFEAFCDLAEKHGIRLIVPLLTGQMTFRNIVPPALANLNPFTDPYALAWEGRYLECLVTRLKAKKAIVAWEAGNEALILGRSENAFRFESWLRYVHQTIRCADPTRPVIGVNGLFIDRHGPYPSVVNASLSDYVTTHPYGFWGEVYNDDFRTVRSVTFATAQTYALEQISGKPAFIEEHGSRRQEQASQANVADYMRAMLWNAWAADAKGMLWWCAFDQTKMTIAPYNWANPCLELGIFRRDRTPYPALKPLRDFAKLQERLPFAALPRAKTRAVVLTMDKDVVHSSYILARQAGFFPRFASPEGEIPDADCYFVPAARGRAGLTTENWEKLKAKVRAGATLYLSWCDTFLDEMETVGGVEVSYRDKEKTVLTPTTAEILEKDTDGNGFLFRNAYGKGTVYVCRRPFEKTLYEGTGGYEGDSWKVWAKVCPVDRSLTTEAQNVFVSEHPFDDGRMALVVVNNARTAYRGSAALASGWRVTSVLTDDQAAAKWTDGRLDLAPCSGLLLMVEKK